MISILMSTHNGELYLKDQIESLLNQTNTNFTLHVRDDCSTDSTLSILEHYKSNFDNIFIYKNNNVRLGACKSFFWLLQNVNDDYYMFCDQDDIWLNNKIDISLNAIKNIEFLYQKGPIILHTDLIITDSNLNILNNSFWNYERLNISKFGKKYLPFNNYISGCTMIFNNKTAKLLNKSNINFAKMHDHFLAILVDASDGKIISLPIPTIYYRQHNNNSIGISSIKLNKIKKFGVTLKSFNVNNFLYFLFLKKIYNISFIKLLAKRIICKII